MIIRAKTKRRVLILLVGLVVVGGCLVGWWRHRLALADAEIQQDKVDGMAAYNAGDYPTAINKLNAYVIKHKTDPEALRAFGISRSKVPTIDGSYIQQAIQIMRKYTSLVPDNLEAQEQLLAMQINIRAYASSAVDLANDILRNHPDDLAALQALVTINIRDRKFQDAYTAAQKYTQLNPADLGMQWTLLELMQQIGKPPAEIHGHADALVAKYPSDPRFLLVKAWSCYYGQSADEASEQRTADMEKARQLILQAAQQDPPDAQFAAKLVFSLDQSHEFGRSLDVLTRAVARLNDPELTATLIRRLWQNHKFEDALARLANLDVNAPQTNVDLIAFKALCLFGLDKNSQAQPLIERLSARGAGSPPADRAAYAWAVALNTLLKGAALDPRTQLAQYQDAANANPANAVVQSMLGDAYNQVGEIDLALSAWRMSSKLAPSWSEPYVRIAMTLARQGKGASDEAGRDSDLSLMTSAEGADQKTRYNNFDAIVAHLEVMYARLDPNSSATDVNNLLKDVAQVQQQVPGEPSTLPIYIALLVRTDQRDKAIDLINTALKQSPHDGGDTLLLRLAQVSRTEKLGLEDSIEATIQKEYGLTPALAYTRASSLNNDGHSAEGLQVLLDGKSKGAGAAQTWDRAICQYREMSHDPGAAKAWEALGDAYPNDLAVQSAIVSSEESAWSDHVFMERTIKRLHDLTGDQATAWKIARARLLLSGTLSDQSVSAAIVLLDEVIALSPQEYLPHELLATGYERSHNKDAAIAEWRKAVALQPDLALPNYSLLHLLQADGKTDEAKAVFDKLASLPHLPPAMVVDAARMMAADGDDQRAENILTAHAEGGSSMQRDATLAKIYHREGRDSDAEALYFKLLKIPGVDTATIREAAEFFGAPGAQRDLAAARQWLDRLDSSGLAAGQRELIQADFEENYGDGEEAARLYEEAVKAAGDDPGAALAQIGFLMRRQQWDAARHATDAALTHWPTNASLTNLKIAQEIFAASNDARRLQPLLIAISVDPGNEAGTQTLRVVANATNANPADTINSLEDLLAKYPDYEPLYSLTIARLLAVGRNDDALSLAAALMSRFAQSATAAATATNAYVVAGDWADALLAAREWRLRDPEHPAMADRLIATADLFLDQAHDAVVCLNPYINDARANPNANHDLLVIYAEALIRSGDESDAAALLMPLANTSITWRADWLKIAAFAHSDGPSAAAWIEQIRPKLDPNSMADQEQVADAYVQCAAIRGYTQGFQIAYDTLKPFVTSDSPTVPVLATFAAAATGIHDRAAAEQAYRQILKINPNLAAAQNNLADFLRQNGDMASLKEAEGLVRAAISANPNDPDLPSFYDTLARVLLAQGKVNDAISAFKAGYHIQPKNLSLLIGLAYASAKSGQMEAAADYLSKIDAQILAGAKVPEELRGDLDSARDAAKKTEARNSVTGTDLGPTAK